MSTAAAADPLSMDPKRMDSLEAQLGEQRDVIKSMLDAFKLLTEENVKKDKRIERMESENSKLKQLISFHLMDGLNGLKSRIDKMDKVDLIDKEIASIKQSIEDVRFSVFSSNNNLAIPGPSGGLRSPSPQRNGPRASMPPPLPFMVDPNSSPVLGASHKSTGPALDRIQSSLENLLMGLEYVARQRNADVLSINTSLEKLDNRVKQLAENDLGSGEFSQSGHRGDDVRHIRHELIPELEQEWSTKWGVLEARIEEFSSEVRKAREDVAAVQDRMVIKDAKMAQLLTSSDTSKRLLDKTEQLTSHVNSRLLKLESDVQMAFEEIHKVEEGHGQIANLESKVDLSKAECRSNWERVIRTTKQDVDSIRIKLERISIVKEEYERLNVEMRSLHELVVSMASQPRHEADARIPSMPAFALGAVSPSPPPLHPPRLSGPSPSIESSSSSLSVMDEGVHAGNTMIARLSAFPSIPVPTGGAESGALRVDASTNRILWRIENLASMIREPSRYPKILVSPEFTVTPMHEGKEGETLVGRMKLFPAGSDQSRIHGNCSFYLRCLPGILVRYSVDIGGEVMDTFECTYEKQRDKGKHDFVRLNEYLQPDGSVTMGIEIKSVALTTS
jgi:hypothetical protein